jgi:hypothetical protein
VIAITVLLIVAAVAAALAAAALAHRVDIVGKLPGRTTVLEADRADDRVAGSFSFLFLTVAATGIVWIIWQFRYSKNAERLGGKLNLGPGWAIGGWFIPIANLALPAVQMSGAAKASDPGRRRSISEGTSVPPVLITWAVTYAIAAIIAAVGRVARPSDEDLIADPLRKLRDFQRADRISLVAMLLYIAAAILAIFVVRTLTARQTEAADIDVTAGPEPPPTIL